MSTSTIVIVVRPTTSIVEPPQSSTLPPPVTSSQPPSTSPVVIPTEPPSSSGSTITQIIVPITTSNSPILPVTSSSSSSTTSSTTARNIVSSILASSVTVGSSTTMSATISPTPTKADASPSESGTSPVLVTTISVVVGGILLALLAAWLIHTLIKSRREKKENDRLAADEDLDGMFQAPVMGSISSGRSMYDHNESFWDQKNQDNRLSIVSVDNLDYSRQSPESDGNFISGSQDSEDHGGSESSLQANSNVEALEVAAVSGAAVDRTELSRQVTMGSTSTTPLIPNAPTGGNFVRVISDYVAVRPDELNMRQGQILMLEQTFQDGWAYGKNITTQERGMFPFNFVASVDPSLFQR